MTDSNSIDSFLKYIPCVGNNGRGPSFFSTCEVPLKGLPERMLSEQIKAKNFRLRSSDQHYGSGWHVAGDPTLLIVLSGTVRIELRSGEFKDFSVGQIFIAQDYLQDEVEFNDVSHGHRAEVVGGEPIFLLHLKLDSRVRFN